jgi:large subunit ribosomal protein L23
VGQKIMNILIKPLLTEKSYKNASDLNSYTFIVAKDANKIQITQETEKKFGVNVTKVRVINQLGKIKVFGAKRSKGRQSNSKKAIITLKKGQKIDLFEMK